MRNAAILTVIVFFCAAVAYAASTNQMHLKVGEQIQACDCGEICPCEVMSRKPGRCTCGKPMVKATVTKVENGWVMLKSPTWKEECPFKTTGKYSCNCGPSCTCGAISQNPGHCPCGTEMKTDK